MSEEEKVLVRKAKAGDSDAFAELYQLYHPKIYRYVFFRVPTAAVAEDITAEVFVRLVERIDDFTYRGRPLLAWLYTIARNLVADYHRRQGRSDFVPLDDRLVSDSDHGNPVYNAEVSLLQQRMADALEELTEDQRQVVILRFFEEMDNRSVAELLGKTVGAVKALQHRAIRALHRQFSEDGESGRAAGPDSALSTLRASEETDDR
jgi:RNA polymerase sigma-70 factor (ECF subfamily)